MSEHEAMYRCTRCKLIFRASGWGNKSCPKCYAPAEWYGAVEKED